MTNRGVYHMRTRMKSSVEDLAVYHTGILCSEPKVFLKPYIEMGDKRLSFDGDIEIYSDSTGKKQTYVGKASVQVKGNTVKKHALFSASQSMKKLDLEFY